MSDPAATEWSMFGLGLVLENERTDNPSCPNFLIVSQPVRSGTDAVDECGSNAEPIEARDSFCAEP